MSERVSDTNIDVIEVTVLLIALVNLWARVCVCVCVCVCVHATLKPLQRCWPAAHRRPR